MIQRIRAYLTALAGKHLGFDATIADLNVEVNALKTECRSLNHAINTMEDKWMDKYRELERTIPGGNEAPLQLRLYETQLGMPEHQMTMMHGALSPFKVEDDAIMGKVTREDIKLARISMGFSFDPERSRPECVAHRIALAFARKAADLAYDAVMKRYHHRPEVKNPLDASRRNG